MKKLNKIIPLFAAMVLSAVLLSSCLKDHNNYVPPPSALLMVIQGSQDAPAESIFLDQNRVNADPFNYGDNIGYFNAFTGQRKLALYNFVGVGQGTPTTKFAADTIQLKAYTNYSLFLANTYTHPDFILLTDTINAPAINKATVRLVNASPDAGSVDMVAINAHDTTLLVGGKPYKSASTFLPVAGNKYYKFFILTHGSKTVIAKVDSVPVYSGSVYTVWLHGLAAGTGNAKINAGFINNARFFK